MSKKKVIKEFKHYEDAHIYCILRDIYRYKVVKNNKSWAVVLSTGVPLRE